MNHQDLRLKMTVKNNVLWHAIYDKYESVSNFCRKMSAAGYNFREGYISRLLSFKVSPFKKLDRDVYTVRCVRLSAAVAVPVEDLFPPHLYEKITVSWQVIEVNSFSELPTMVKEKMNALPAPVEQSPFFQVIDAELEDSLNWAVGTLTCIQQEVIRMRFGLGEYDGRTHTLEEVGLRFGLSTQRVRQVVIGAIQRLQHPVRAKKLENFVGQ